MRQVTLYITDTEYEHFIQLARNLHYVKKVETDEEPTKEDVLENIKSGLEDVRLYNKGKLKTTLAIDFLNFSKK